MGLFLHTHNWTPIAGTLVFGIKTMDYMYRKYALQFDNLYVALYFVLD